MSEAALRKYLRETPEAVRAAWAEADRQYRRVERGQARNTPRMPASQWKKKENSSEPLIWLIQAQLFPDLLTADELTERRIETILKWYAMHRLHHPQSDQVHRLKYAALKKAINRARLTARRK